MENPFGRPKGVRNKAILLAEKLLENETEEICRQAIELAKKVNISGNQDHLGSKMAMMEAKFKGRRSRYAQIKKLRAEVDRCKQNLLRFDQQRFISGELEEIPING